MNGERALSSLSALDGTGHYSNGLSLYAYLGANPVSRQDASGLDYFDEIDELIFSVQAERTAGVTAVSAYVGSAFNAALVIGQLAISFLPGYDAVMLGVALARGDKVNWYDFVFAGMDFAGPLGKLANKFMGALGNYRLGVRAVEGAKNANAAIDGFQNLFRILPFRQAQKLTAGFKGRFQAHHIIESRYLQKWGVSVTDAPAVILTKEMHDEVTLALRTAIPYGHGTGTATKAQVLAVYRRVYTELGLTDCLPAIEQFFK
jgi:hypothetical protein